MEYDGVRQGNPAVIIMKSDGRTEAKALEDFYRNVADVIVDSVQRGDSLKAAGLVQLETIMESSARLYTRILYTLPSETITGRQTRNTIEDLARLLVSASKVLAEQSYTVAMNIEPKDVERITMYLLDMGLCRKAPTISMEYKGNQALEVVIPRSAYPQAVSTLLRLGADDIINRDTGAIVSSGDFQMPKVRP